MVRFWRKGSTLNLRILAAKRVPASLKQHYPSKWSGVAPVAAVLKTYEERRLCISQYLGVWCAFGAKLYFEFIISIVHDVATQRKQFVPAQSGLASHQW